jgi:hypothetical protein
MYKLSKHTREETQESMLKELVTLQLVAALLYIATRTISNSKLAYLVERATAVLSRVVSEEYPVEIANHVTQCEQFMHTTLPYMLQDKQPLCNEDAIILITHASGIEGHPEFAQRCGHLVECIAERLYDKTSSNKFNMWAIVGLINVIDQLTRDKERAHYSLLFESATVVTVLMENVKHFDPDIAHRVLSMLVYLADLAPTPLVMEQLTDQSFIQDVSELAFHSATNKQVSEKAMHLLTLLEHLEEDEVIMRGTERTGGVEDFEQDEEQYYWTGVM